MSQIPIYRNELKQLKQKADEERKIHHIKTIISLIYDNAKQSAKLTTETLYKYQVPLNKNDDFYSKNMADILKGLQELFPDCSVTHTLFAKGTDGKMYDISKLDDTVLPFVNTALNNSYIVIDWS